MSVNKYDIFNNTDNKRVETFKEAITYNKVIIVDKKNLIFVDKFKENGFEVFSMTDFLNYLMDQLCEIICTDVRSTSLNKFQKAEFINTVESYFDKYCIEKYIIIKFAGKKILIIEPITERSIDYFVKFGFVKF